MSERVQPAPALAYQRVSDGAWFCASCLGYWLLFTDPEPSHRPCHDAARLYEIVCRDCGRLVLREPVEGDLLTAYDDPLAWAQSDSDWW